MAYSTFRSHLLAFPLAGSPGAVGASLLRSIQNHQAHQAAVGGAGPWSKPSGDDEKYPIHGNIGGCLFVYDWDSHIK